MKEIIKNSIVKNGLYAAGILVGYTLLVYLLEMNMFSPVQGLLSLLISLGTLLTFAFLAISTVRKQVETHRITFLNAWLISSLVIFIASFISNVVSLLLMHVVDNAYYVAKYKEMMFKVAEQTDNNPDVMKRLQDGFNNIQNFEISSLVTTLVTLFVSTAILSAITALIAKKKDRIEDNINAI
ncbi:MAG: hypothetical protein CVU11_07200 [Bacteroidetes bacterium HGW-Bacteroidetes-6]|jgi:hypothetical protein|nr:MAG: hypothetical protein CVU11_07200 [Bacteroidetes bacterium HGW-Bacteroidetes-6]